MRTLDLHGVYHESVERLVENFILLHDSPVKIITGRSPRMIKIVHETLAKHNMTYYPENYTNFGAYIVMDKTK